MTIWPLNLTVRLQPGALTIGAITEMQLIKHSSIKLTFDLTAREWMHLKSVSRFTYNGEWKVTVWSK